MMYSKSKRRRKTKCLPSKGRVSMRYNHNKSRNSISCVLAAKRVLALLLCFLSLFSLAEPAYAACCSCWGWGCRECEARSVSGSCSEGLWGLTIDRLSTRSGPSTLYQDMGTYNVKGQWLYVHGRAWDSRNGIWWVLVDIPYGNEIRTLWTGYKRFDSRSLQIDWLPIL